nr:hypothetical protein [Vibrio sp. 03_296]
MNVVCGNLVYAAFTP